MFKAVRVEQWLFSLETRDLLGKELSTINIEDIKNDDGLMCSACEMPDNTWLVLGHGQSIRAPSDTALSLFFEKTTNFSLDSIIDKIYSKL